MAQHSHAGSDEDVADLFSDCFWEIKGFKQVSFCRFILR